MLSFADAPGNLFNVLGKLGLVLSQADSYQNSQLTNLTDTVEGVVAQLDAESDIQALVGSSYIGQLNSPGQTVGSLVQTVASAIINRKVFRDNPRLQQTLTQQTTLASIYEVIRQMKIQGATVRAATVTTTVVDFEDTPAQPDNTGNGVINTSVRRPLDGVVLENSFSETLLFTVTDDSYVGSATAGNEPLQVTGTGSVGVFAFDWPLGSNATVSLSAIDGNTDVGSGNLLTNSGFEEFTSNAPDNWTIVTGAAGTNYFEETGLIYDGTAALKLTGDGSTLLDFRQTFNSSTGTTGTLEPLAQYSGCLWMRRDGTAAAAGQLRVSLVDGNGTIVNDQNGTPNSSTIDLTTLTVDYEPQKFVWRTPAIMPSTYAIRLDMPTGNALTNGRSVYLDKLGLGLMTQVYSGGPFVAVHAGSTPFLTGDYATVAVTNGRGAGGTLNTFQTLLYRLFPDVGANEVLFPSSNTPTISDTDLIA